MPSPVDIFISSVKRLLTFYDLALKQVVKTGWGSKSKSTRW